MALTHPESCTGGKITHISDLLNSFFSRKPRRKNALAAHASLNVYQGTWLLRQGEAERRFKTGIDLRLVSGMGIEQNSRGFIAFTIHVLCMDSRGAGVIRQCCQQFSLPGFACELCSVLNHRLYTKLVNSFPGHCVQCLLYRA